MNDSDEKLFYKIGEVAELVGVQPYVIRYWLKEFPQLAPSKKNSGQRRFSKKEVTLIRFIAYLRYDQKITIAGIKKILRNQQSQDRLFKEHQKKEKIKFTLHALRSHTTDILQILEKRHS